MLHKYSTMIGLAIICMTLTACGGSSSPSSDTDNSSQPDPTLPDPTVSEPTVSTLSGTISIGSGIEVDSDTNDPNAEFASNDTPALAQAISNPTIVGGYVNEKGTGALGLSFASGDRSDLFRVSLAANQVITLNIADFETGDLDLYLYFDDDDVDLLNPDFGSTGTGKTETLTIASEGNYLIEVYAYGGYTNYSLVLSQNLSGSATHASHQYEQLRLSDDFVPGDVILRFNDKLKTANSSQNFASKVSTLGLTLKSGGANRPLRAELANDPQARQQSLAALSLNQQNSVRTFKSQDPVKQQKMDTLQAIKLLRKRADILYAEPNYKRKALQVPSDQHYSLQWHYPLINLPSAWDVSTGDAGVIVAVIDTGVLLNHPDLIGQFSADGGYDFIADNNVSQDGESGIDDNPDDPGDSAVGSVSSFHGTHVAGTIAAATSFSGGTSGVAGVAPGAKIMPLRVLGNGGGTSYDTTQAVLYAAGLANDSGSVPASKADIINLSLGGYESSQSEQDIFTQARNAGVIIVAAAGNESTSNLSYPAAYDGVISVSAVDINKQLAPYSNFGSTIDIAAPGGDGSTDVNGDGYPDNILSTMADDSGSSIVFNFAFSEGTSMSAPHMAGVVALMKSVYENLSPANVDSLLIAGDLSEDIGTVGRDNQYGHGLINARKAVDAALELAGQPVVETPFLSASPSSLNFSSNQTSLSLAVVNGGSGTLSIDAISDDADWLNITSTSVDTDTQLGTYTVAADPSSLSDGIHTATISIQSAVNTLNLPVIIQIGQSSSIDAGYHYVILIDAETDLTVSQWEGKAEDGVYHFEFENVSFEEDQRFFLFAGSDKNNDLVICDPGEACGAYIALDQPKVITATDTHSNLDFSTAYSVGLQSLSTSNSSSTAPEKKRLVFKQLSD